MSSPIVFHSVVNFYALEGMKAELLRKTREFQFVKSYEKLLTDLEDYSSRYNKKLAEVLFDHTVLCVQTELRHAKLECHYYIPNYYGDGWYKNYSDEMCFASYIFNPLETLKAGYELFDEGCYSWEFEYGGDNWWNIANAGLMYHQVPDVVFIDHVVDLSHNNDFYLMKKTGLFLHSPRVNRYNYETMLNTKRYEKFSVFCDGYIAFFCKDILNFYRRFLYVMGIDDPDTQTSIQLCLGKPDVLCEEAIKAIFNYKPIKWGNQHVEIENLQQSPFVVEYDEYDEY